MKNSLFLHHPEGARLSRVHPGYLFPISLWAKARFRPVSKGSPGRNALCKTAENGQRPLDETPYPGRLWMDLDSSKGQSLIHFSIWWLQTGPFARFSGPTGSRANLKTSIWQPCKNCWWKWFQLNLIIEVSCETGKGPTSLLPGWDASISWAPKRAHFGLRALLVLSAFAFNKYWLQP